MPSEIHEMEKGSTGEVRSLQNTHFNKFKLTPGWKLACATLCTIAMLLECTNVILSSRRTNNNHPINLYAEDLSPDYRVVPVTDSIQEPVNQTDLCSERKEFILGIGHKRVNVCTYQQRVRIDVREFLNDQSTIRGIHFTSKEYIMFETLSPSVRDEMKRQLKLIEDTG